MIRKNVKHRKTLLIILVIFILLLLVLVFYLVSTRNKYYNNIYWDYLQPTQYDTEYLNVWDLRFVPDNEETETLKNLGQELLKCAYETNGIRPEKYKNIISDFNFEQLNPRCGTAMNVSEIIYEDYEIKEFDVINHDSKAIIFWGFTYKANSNENGDLSICGCGYEGYPNRMYLELLEGEWIVTSVFLIQ